MSQKRNTTSLTACAAWIAALGVGAGAFGAHALNKQLQAANTLKLWEIAVQYHLLHALAAFAAGLAIRASNRPETLCFLIRAGWCWLGGIALFSGSLYGMALGGPRLLGPVTPLGGVLFIAGWVMAAIGLSRESKTES